jgi:hypothetical protein
MVAKQNRTQKSSVDSDDSELSSSESSSENTTEQ